MKNESVIDLAVRREGRNLQTDEWCRNYREAAEQIIKILAQDHFPICVSRRILDICTKALDYGETKEYWIVNEETKV